jgi:biopolymer transport protein ExbB
MNQYRLTLLLAIAFIGLSLTGGQIFLTPGRVLAQDPAAPAGETILDDDAIVQEAAAPAAQVPAPTAQAESLLGWMYKSLGFSYSIIFLALSVTLVSLVVMNLMSIRRESILPTELVQTFETHIKDKKYQDAYQLVESDESFLGRVLESGMGNIQKSYDKASEAMQETGEDENMKLEHRLSYIGLIGTVSPMIGLLGTVQGMIDAFRVIATSETTPQASQLAEGISRALFTTLLGLMIAIPAIAIFNVMQNRLARYVLEAGMVTEDLMGRFATVGKKKV